LLSAVLPVCIYLGTPGTYPGAAGAVIVNEWTSAGYDTLTRSGQISLAPLTESDVSQVRPATARCAMAAVQWAAGGS